MVWLVLVTVGVVLLLLFRTMGAGHLSQQPPALLLGTSILSAWPTWARELSWSYRDDPTAQRQGRCPRRGDASVKTRSSMGR
jgi:hypothetical protein